MDRQPGGTPQKWGVFFIAVLSSVEQTFSTYVLHSLLVSRCIVVNSKLDVLADCTTRRSVMEIQIVCINKPYGHYNAHEAVLNYGFKDPSSGKTTITSRQDMVEWAKNQGNIAYVLDNYGRKVNCYVNRKGITEFLQTYADGVWTDNLLALNECPVSTG